VDNTLKDLPRPFFVLAPMDDVTDIIYRQIIADCAKPDLFITEFVNVDGLQSPGRPKLIDKLNFTKKEQPIFAQIWGKNPENYFKTAKELVKMGFAGIDINMGCPDKSIVRHGGCSALINNRELAAEIITGTKQGAAGKIPVSVKMRTGFDGVNLSWPEFILKQGVDMLTIHGRTTKEMSKVPARWQDIAKVRQMRDKIAPKTLIVGNGDVMSRAQGEELAKKYKLDGIMIGRGALADPYVFAAKSPWSSLTPVQKMELYKKHLELHQKTRGNVKFQGLKKFAKNYINGFSDAGNIRSEFVRKQSLEEMIQVLDEAISSAHPNRP
jgi:tRNA-dihydrouridine synthase